METLVESGKAMRAPLPKRRRRPKMKVRKPSHIRCPAHLKWVRGHECVMAALLLHFCDGKVEAAHVRSGTDGGVGIKPSDIWAIPLCSRAHRYQHDIGEVAFEKEFDINLREIAEGLARWSPHRKKWETP